MRPGAQGPSDGEGTRREFDAGWDDVLGQGDGPVATAPADEPRTGVEDAPTDVGPRVAESSSTDLPTATLEQETAEPDERVERETQAGRETTMMSGSWALATRDASAPTSAAGSASNMRVLRDSDAEMAALMGARGSPSVGSPPSDEPSSSPAASAETPKTAVPEADAASPSIASQRSEPGPAVADEPTSTRPKTGPAGVVRSPGSGSPRRMPSPEPRRITARTSSLELGAKPRRLSLGWAVVAGIGIAGVAWLIGGPARQPTAPVVDASQAKPVGATKRDGGREAPAAVERNEPGRAPDGAALAKSDGAGLVEPKPEPSVESKPEVTPPKPVAEAPVSSDRPRPSNRGVRTPPPGTPADIAATFVRLPVSPADLPPVGGVGSSGIHIDRVDMGASYDNKTGCVGVANQFSLAANEEINVCLRVVHPRQEEVMSIVWQKNDGSTARRGKIAVKPIHAYRTRAYLRLRAEYIGAWTVRILSPDGVELASHAFTITP